ncbi:MAG TPA: hypothetical protein VKX17_15425 [Planctomycetota bacterium]|nr:hypothetical protein [Planctomycetota bacterium]
MTAHASPGDDALRRTPERAERWHVIVPPAALLFQAIPPLTLWLIARVAYVQPNHPPQNWERPVTLIALFVFSAVSFALSGFGIYGLLTRVRMSVAVPVIAICCFPALLCGATYLHGLLVFLTWV